MTAETKRYNLVLPMDTFEQVRRVAEERQTSVAHVLRQFIKFGLAVESSPETTLIVRRGEEIRELVLL